MRRVRAPLALEVDLRVATTDLLVAPTAPSSGRPPLSRLDKLGLERLQARPGLDQGPVGAEMLVRQQLLHLGPGQHRGEELRGDLAIQQLVEDFEKVEWSRLARQPKARRTSGTRDRTRAAPSTDAPSGWCRTPATASPEQHLRRDRRPTLRRPRRARRTPCSVLQRLVDDRTDRAQRMIRPNPRLHIDVGKELARATIRSAYSPLLDSLAETINHVYSAGATAFFDSLLGQRGARQHCARSGRPDHSTSSMSSSSPRSCRSRPP